MKKGNRSKDKDDPAWNRSRRNSKKSHKMCSRGSLKVLRSLIKNKRAADRLKGKTVCVTRTVELPSTERIGDERSKLLFMIAIGLVPSSGSVSAPKKSPRVVLKKLDPLSEAQAQTRTMERLFALFHKRQSELNPRIPIPQSQSPLVYRVRISPAKNTNVEVETVDLVSSDEDDDSSECRSVGSESSIESIKVLNGYHTPYSSMHESHNQKPRSHMLPLRNTSPSWYPPPENYRILACSKPRQPVFKPIVNNQDSGIFRNWKPESMTRLMNINKITTTPNNSPSIQSAKLMNSLTSISSSPSVNSKNFKSATYNGGIRKGDIHGAREQAATSISNYVGPEAIITID